MLDKPRRKDGAHPLRRPFKQKRKRDMCFGEKLFIAFTILALGVAGYSNSINIQELKDQNLKLEQRIETIDNPPCAWARGRLK